MANDCNYEMKIKGSKNAIKRVIDCLKADYNYEKGKPTHKHFFRVFDVDDESVIVKNSDGTYSAYVWGVCAWSVRTCMAATDRASYYGMVKRDYPDIFMGTTLQEQSKNCEIEVFSEEWGMCFSEHYLYKNGKCLIDDCVDFELVDYNYKTKEFTKIDDSGDYFGEVIPNNPNREGIDEGFKWVLD